MISVRVKVLLIYLFLFLCVPTSPAGMRESSPSCGYGSQKNCYGWMISIHQTHPHTSATKNAYRFLEKALTDFHLSLTEDRAAALKRFPLVIHDQKEKPTICYQPEHKRIEINDLIAFYRSSCDQNGASLITSFGQAYYASVLSETIRQEIAEALNRSQRIPDFQGHDWSPANYFAEWTTAYFGVRKSIPQDYHALLQFDPYGFKLMEKIWGRRNLKDYRRVFIAGFRVLFPLHSEQAPETIEALDALREDLEEINRLVPQKFVNLFRRKILWLDHTNEGGACYHPDIGWLLKNGVIPEKCRCVEITNMKHYTRWRKQNQPFMLLHEYAHLFHFSSYADNDEIPKAYRHAMRHHLYDSVAYQTGSDQIMRKAYAATNAFEFFSEVSEAYFGRNDFYPFTRQELRKHDPVTYALLEKIWNEAHFTE